MVTNCWAPMKLLMAALSVLATVPAAQAVDDPWPDIKKSVFQGRKILESSSLIEIFAPTQAVDAAVVPLSITIASAAIGKVKSLRLVIDRNPMPLAAIVTFGDGFRNGTDIGDRTLATRVRVDAFSRIRAVLETDDGQLHMASKFVVGSGGCSAPASKNMEQSLAQLGRAQIKLFGGKGRQQGWHEAQIMIRHPNFTGMQRDAATGDYAPARYVNAIEVRQGDEMLLKIEGGISISEDPNIRFTFGSKSEQGINFTATDTTGATFSATSKPDPS